MEHVKAIANAMNSNQKEENKEVIDNDYYKSPIKENDEPVKPEEEENTIAKNDQQKQEGESVIESKTNDKNYGRTGELYVKSLLNKQLRQHFITIPQSEQDLNELFENLKTASKNIKYLCVAQEKHINEGNHYHILLTANKGVRIEQIHKRIMKTEGSIGGSINYQKVTTSCKAVETYIKKDGKYKEHGTLQNQLYNKDTKDLINEDLNNIYTNDNTYEENIHYIKTKQPAYYTQYKEKIENEVKAKDEKPLKKWEPPVYTHENTTLKPYQNKIWELINQPPKQRRIIWVNGKPNTGKSFMFNYINENYDYGIYSAGSTASLDNAVYGYEEQGAIAWDIPKNYDYETFGNALASTIEKFSDYGQHLTSRKYAGKKIQVKGHVIVFSNRPVLAQLKHRDIIEINTHDDLTQEEKLKVWNIRIRTNKKGNKIWEETLREGQEEVRKYYNSIEDLPYEIRQDVYNTI